MVAGLNLVDVEICRRCVGVLVADRQVDATLLALPVFLHLLFCASLRVVPLRRFLLDILVAVGWCADES